MYWGELITYLIYFNLKIISEYLFVVQRTWYIGTELYRKYCIYSSVPIFVSRSQVQNNKTRARRASWLLYDHFLDLNIREIMNTMFLLQDIEATKSNNKMKSWEK